LIKNNEIVVSKDLNNKFFLIKIEN